MSRLKLIGLCVAAALASGSLAAASAWAEAPEIGRCVSHAGGKYTNNVCTKLAKGKKVGSFEWEAGAVKNKFSGTGGTGTLETVALAQVKCKTEASHGEFTSSKTVGNVAVSFTGCESGGYKCDTVGAKEGEIVDESVGGYVGVGKIRQEGRDRPGAAVERTVRRIRVRSSQRESQGLGPDQHPGGQIRNENRREVHSEKGQTETGILLHVENGKGQGRAGQQNRWSRRGIRTGGSDDHERPDR